MFSARVGVGATPAAAGARGTGTVYLIHFDTPYKQARHYTGWTTDLHARLEAHRAGRGARLMEVITDAGVTWHLARTWPGPREPERTLTTVPTRARTPPLTYPNRLNVRSGSDAGTTPDSSLTPSRKVAQR